MRHEDLKVGMLVRANELSNDEYSYTTAEKSCEGVVKEIESSAFELLVTKNKDKNKIGNVYRVNAEYFDIVKENAGMVVELKTTEKRVEFGYGDLLLFGGGKQVLVITDTDGSDYRGMILGEYRPTNFRSGERSFIKMLEEEYELGSLVRVIKADKLKLMEI